MSSERSTVEPPVVNSTHASPSSPPIVAAVLSSPAAGDRDAEVISAELVPTNIEDLTHTVAAAAGPQSDGATHSGSVEKAGQSQNSANRSWIVRAVRAPFYLAARLLDLLTLIVLLSFVAAVPLLQFAALGYLLTAGGRLAQGRPWRDSLPGLRLAGRIGLFALMAGIAYLPIVLILDVSDSAKFLEPNSAMSTRWQLGAFAATVAWLTHIGWAAMRGGRWWHLLWPAPVRFVKQIWRPSTWGQASDRLYDFVAGLQLPKLWWLGARATVAALLWLIIPVSMMIIGQRVQAPVAPLIGALGAILMAWVMFYLPFLQIEFARTGSMKSFLSLRQTRQTYAFAPWAHTVGLVVLSALSIPIYLLRIEQVPDELLWAPTIVFALLMLPSKLLLGWAVGYSRSRQERSFGRRRWFVRMPAKVVSLAAISFYIGALYVAQLIAGQGAYVMYFQHAFLVPNPLLP